MAKETVSVESDLDQKLPPALSEPLYELTQKQATPITQEYTRCVEIQPSLVCLQSVAAGRTDIFSARTFELLYSHPKCFQIVHAHQNNLLLDDEVYDPVVSLKTPIQRLLYWEWRMGQKCQHKMKRREYEWIQSMCSLGEWLMLGHCYAGSISLLKWEKDENQFTWHLTNHRTVGTRVYGREIHNSITNLFWFGESLSTDEGQLYTVWSVHNHMQVHRYSIPIANPQRLERARLLISDPDQTLSQLHAQKVSG